MANLSHFMIPAATRPGTALLFRPPRLEDRTGTAFPRFDGNRGDAVPAITTGPKAPGTLNSGGLYKRQLDEPILDFVQVEDIDAAVSKVEKLGGTIAQPITAIPGVGLTAMILDTEGNLIGLWTR